MVPASFSPAVRVTDVSVSVAALGSGSGSNTGGVRSSVRNWRAWTWELFMPSASVSHRYRV